jgi:hypothetical protein
VELAIDVRQSAEVGSALAAGLGDVGLSLMVPVERGLAEGRVMEVPTPKLSVPRAYTYLVHGAELAPAAAAFADLLRRSYGHATLRR